MAETCCADTWRKRVLRGAWREQVATKRSVACPRLVGHKETSKQTVGHSDVRTKKSLEKSREEMYDSMRVIILLLEATHSLYCACPAGPSGVTSCPK